MSIVIIALVAFVVFSYAGYPVWLSFLSFVRPRPVRRGRSALSVTVVIAARNEEKRIERKLENIRQQNYHATRLEVIVVSDGSTDGTVDCVQRLCRDWQNLGSAPSLRCIALPVNRGKACALNEALKMATGEVVVFADTRQEFEPDVISLLLENMADPEVGAVSGQLRFRQTEEGRDIPVSLGLYWRLETLVRKKQAITGSVMGATGAIYAMRRELWLPLPENMLVDDLYAPLRVVDVGKRVVFDARAVAWDRMPENGREEFRRKVRTLTGVWQCLPIFGKWVKEGRLSLAARFFAHKLSRLLVPWALCLILILPFFQQQAYWSLFGVLQLAGYLAALLMPVLPALGRFGPVRTAHFFVLLNLAAAASLFHAIKGPSRHLWTPSTPRRPS